MSINTIMAMVKERNTVLVIRHLIRTRTFILVTEKTERINTKVYIVQSIKFRYRNEREEQSR